MIVLVCGGRDWDDERYFMREMDKIAEERFNRTIPDAFGNYLYDVTIIAGGAPGVDSYAAAWAMVNWTQYKEFRADWKNHGRSAGPKRNQRMLDEGEPDLVIAFPGGKGTEDMVRRAEKADVEVIRVPKRKRLTLDF